MSNAANQAILADMGQTAAVREAKRELFEEVAHAHYEERWSGHPDGAMSREEFCRKNEDGSYFYKDLNQVWWGFQAGFTAAALAGAKA